ncbi:MAG TPA: SRPBCC domain-containing protein, partial [Actinomycetota bacterium]|nr:SRPBCC domain-containing protein [Actinomycetota bacterium]
MSDLKVVADPGTQEIVITRTFDAPRELVFKAFTDPDAVRRWWGQAGSETVVDQLEARPGGRWRYVERDGEGNEDAFHGVYHDL